jgi:hypothetical protein
LRASYCFSFLTFADLLGTGALLSVGDVGVVPVPCEVHAAGCSESWCDPYGALYLADNTGTRALGRRAA